MGTASCLVGIYDNRPKWMKKIAKSYLIVDSEGPFAHKFPIVVYAVHLYQVICLKVVHIIRPIRGFKKNYNKTKLYYSIVNLV
jgi:hypothetical protein